MIKNTTTKTINVKSFFVYGTLRPDDNSQAPWTKQFTNGLKFQKSIFKDGILFFDEFPVVSLLYSNKDYYHFEDSEQEVEECNSNNIKKFDEKTNLLNLYKDNKCTGIVGYIAQIDESLLTDKNDIDKLFNEKLKEADIIEEYPEIYKRSIIKVKPINENENENGASTITTTITETISTTNEDQDDDHVYCYIYHRVDDFNKDIIIPHGDWVKRNFK